MTSLHAPKRFFIVSLGLLTVVLAGSSFAQSDPYQKSPPGPFHVPNPPYPIEMGHWHNHCSTAAEGYLRGLANLIQAHGNYLLSSTQSMILYEQARWMDLQNDVEVKRSRFQLAQVRAAERDWERDRKFQRVAVGRAQLAVRVRTLYSATYELSPNALDTETGWITWPAVLESIQFNDYRNQLDELFRRHAAYGDPQPANAARIARCVRHMTIALRQNSKYMPQEQYLAAQSFLRGLKYAANEMVESAQSQSSITNLAMAGGPRG